MARTSYGTGAHDSTLGKPSKSRFDEDDLLLEEQDPITLTEKLSFALGALVNAISVACTGFYLNPYLLEVAQISPGLVAMMMLVGRLWDAVTTAIVGGLVAKWPNLKLWLKLATLPTCASYFLLWWTFEKWSSGARLAWALGMYLLYQLGTSAYHVPYTALTVRMHWDSKQRDLATTWRMLAEILSVLFGAGVQAVIISVFNEDSTSKECNCDAQNNSFDDKKSRGYVVSAFIMTSVMLIGGFVCPMGVVERVKSNPVKEGESKSLVESVKPAFGSRSFVMLTSAFFFIWLTVQGVQGNIMLYCQHAMEWENEFSYILGTLVFCATIGMPLWMVLMKRFGKRRCYMTGGLMFAPVLHALYWLPSDTHFGWGILLCVIGGFALAAAYLLPWAMLPAVIDEAELVTGKREEAIFYSFFVFFMKLGAGMALAASAMALQFADWESCSCKEQPDSVKKTLRVLIGIAGPVLILIGVVFAFFFPIGPEREAEIAEQMEQLRIMQPEPAPERLSISEASNKNHVPMRASLTSASDSRRRYSTPAGTGANPLAALQPNGRPHSLVPNAV